jgi:hypothetical protein
MARILFAWQLGGGMGHLLQMLPLAQGLAERGHTVFAAFKEVGRAVSLYQKAGVRFLNAPSRSDSRKYFPRSLTLAHLLGNTGFGNKAELFGMASVWRNIFMLTRPHLVVFDHTPAGLLAARGLPCRRALIGTGFFTPPNVSPLPVLRSGRYVQTHADAIDPCQLARDEDSVLANANWMLSLWKQPPLEQLGQLYAQVDECFMTTFAELDHCPDRGIAPRYWGPVNGAGGLPPQWSEAPESASSHT